MSHQSDSELDQMLEQIFQGAESLPADQALERALELTEDDSQGFDPLSVLVSTIGRIILRLDRIEAALNKLSTQKISIAPLPEGFGEAMEKSFQQVATCPHEVLSPPQEPPGDQQSPSSC